MTYALMFMVLSSGVGQTPDGAESAQTASEPRGYHLISADMRDAMRREALAKTDAERGQALRDMSKVYLEIVHDPRLETAPTLQKYKATMWSRFNKVKTELKRQVAREKEESLENQGDVALDENQASSQQEAIEASSDLAAQMEYISLSMGGPAIVFSEAGGSMGGGAVADNGEALIDLIERTISPEFWDTNGGPGSIFYFQPLMALVVRASDDVHRNLGGTLDALRRAGM